VNFRVVHLLLADINPEFDVVRNLLSLVHDSLSSAASSIAQGWFLRSRKGITISNVPSGTESPV
jgi:hypothetical protein